MSLGPQIRSEDSRRLDRIIVRMATVDYITGVEVSDATGLTRANVYQRRHRQGFRSLNQGE